MTEPVPGADPFSLIGTRCGPYLIKEELGAGAMGTVFLAEEPGSEPVALKLLHPHLLRRKGFFTRFRREAAAGRQVDHPNVVRTFDCDLLMVQGRFCFFLVMEYAEGRTLRDLMHELGTVPEGLLREIALQMAAGLAAIHGEDIIHRDLKPENVLFAKDQRIRIMDLGVAKLEDSSFAVTMDGKFAGSLLYIAPEQIRQEKIGHAADLYSLGVMLHELATGENPFLRDSAAAVMYAHLHHDPPPPHSLSPFLASVISTLLAKNPRDRFQSAGALHRALVEVEKSAWWQERREDTEWRTTRGVQIPVRRSTRVYGRDDERKTLEEAWERAKAGRGGLVLLEGEAGIGKTRLLDVFAQAASREGATVVYGSYAPSGGGDALVDAVLQHVGEDRLEDELEEFLQATPALVPAVVAHLRREPLTDQDVPLQGGALQTVYSRILRALAQERPLVWAVEDLHYATPEQRRILLALLRAAVGERALIVASSRTPLPHTESLEFERLQRFQRLALRRLKPEEVMQLVHDAFRNRELALRLGGRIAEKSDGVPFFVCEMIRGLCDRKFLAPLSDGRFVETRAIGRIEVPSAVRDLMEARLSGLSPEERMILDVGAVQGFEFDPAVTAQVLGLEKVTVLQSVALMERRLGVVDGQERTCRFDHHLIQEVLHDALMPSLRAEYHTRIGDALAEGAVPTGARAHRVAEHYLKGSDPNKAFPLLLDALDHLGRDHRNAAKVGLADLALAPGAGLEGDLRVKVLLEKAEALHVLGRAEENRETLQAALAEAKRLSDPSARLYVLLDLAARDGGAHVDEALELARSLGDSVAEARVHSTLGALQMVQGRLGDAVGSLDRAASLAHDAGAGGVEAGSLATLGDCMLLMGRNREACAHGERGVMVARETGQRVVGIHAMLNLAAAQSRLGDTIQAEELEEEALQLAASVGYRGGEAMASMALARTRSQLGRDAQARRSYDRALATARETGERALEARVLGEWGSHWLRVGRAEQAMQCFDDSLRLQDALGDPVRALFMRLRKSQLLTEMGMPDRADVEEALEELRKLDAKGFEGYALFVLGRIAETAGEAGEARKRYRQCLHRRRGTHENPAMANILNVLGRLEVGLGHFDEASLYLREAIKVARASTLPNVAAVSAVYLAETPDGDVAKAREAFGRQEMRIPHLTRMDACYVLWRASGERTYLDEARRLLYELRDAAPEAYRRTVLARVPVHAAILDDSRVSAG